MPRAGSRTPVSSECVSCPVPPPPDPASLRPKTDPWPAGREMTRCHAHLFGSTEFNSTGKKAGRFHPFSSDGRIVSTLYAADAVEGAISETILHNVPPEGERRAIRRSDLRDWLRSIVVPRRDLTLVSLLDDDLEALDLTRAQIIEPNPAHYHGTVLWAEALHAWNGPRGTRADGLMWNSRLHPPSTAVVLWGDRVEREDLGPAERPDAHTIPLLIPPGLDMVRAVADTVNVTVIE